MLRINAICNRPKKKARAKKARAATNQGDQMSQKTSKVWKGITLAGLIAIFFGGLLGFSTPSSDSGPYGAILILGGITLAIGKLGAWWCHD